MSVISNYCDRDPLVTGADFIYGNELIAALTVVMPNGKSFICGHPKRGNPPNHGTAPSNIDGPGLNFYKLILGGQGTMGIATSIVLRCLPAPKMQRTFFMEFNDLAPAIETMMKIERKEIGMECFALNDFNMAAFLLRETSAEAAKLAAGEYVGIDGATPWSARQLAQFEALRKELAPWTVVLSLNAWGRYPADKVAYQEQDLKDVLLELGVAAQSTLVGVKDLDTQFSNDFILPTQMQKRYGFKGTVQSLCFYTEGEKAADHEDLIDIVASKYRYAATDVGAFVMPVERGRTFYCEYDLHCNKSDAADTAKVSSLFNDVSEALIDQGAFFDRPYGPWAQMMYSRVGSYTEYLKKVKKQLDPNNILNPGKLCF